jgi:iron complex transport system substrate-binding protein
MRIVSLLPGATEIVAALGAESWLVGVSHECDYPVAVRGLPRVTWSAIDGNRSSAAIDAQVRAARAADLPVIAIDAGTLSALNPM